MNRQRIIEFLLGIIVFTIVSVLLTKRFLYFRASSHYISTVETYRPIDNGHLHAWFYDTDKPHDKIILYCYGDGKNMSHYESKVVSLKNFLKYPVMIFDYSGHGKSGGVPSEQQLYNDVSLMVSMLLQTHSPNNIILYGESMGCSVATYAARRYGIPTLILETPIPNMKVVMKNKYKFSIFSGLFTDFEIFPYLNGYKGKSLLLHSLNDEIIPYSSIAHLLPIVSLHIPTQGSHKNPVIPLNEIKKFIEMSK